jgi:general secretion pathway protein F
MKKEGARSTVKSGAFAGLLSRTFDPFSLPAEMTIAFREFAALYHSGIPLVWSLRILAEQTSHPELKDAFAGCLGRVQSGMSLALALARYPRVFPELYVRMIDIGEHTGRLELMLERIAQHAEKKRGMAMKLQSALTYPLFTSLFFILFLIIGPAFVFKGIFVFLQDLHIPLPFATRMLISLSSLVRSPLFFLTLVLLCGAFFPLRERLRKDQRWKGRIEGVLFSIPGIGSTMRLSETATFARIMATVSDTGLSLLAGLQLARRSSATVTLRRKIDKALDMITEGATLRAALEDTAFFPPLVLHLLEAGEASGKVGSMLERAASLCEQSLEQSVETAMQILQPFILLVMGIIVGFMIIATMLPLIKMIQGI